METSIVEIAGQQVTLHTLHTLIIGSGAAALNCAEHLYDYGVRDIAIATDKLGAGTSNNSGSDKQTYYKLAVCADAADSPIEFARTLTAGGMCHGDIAYVEGACSLQEFYHLVKNGVEFPFNEYGAYVGYKTDHDPRQRATSAGPKTSIQMVSCSLAQVRRNGTPILDGHEVIRLLVSPDGSRVIGALAIDKQKLSETGYGLVLFNCTNVVMATGGPGEMYATSVYPPGQIGNHGLALEIGAVAHNLTESQFGLASVGFRWNLSGTYQQVIPAYFSDDNGRRRYFLNEYFYTTGQKASNIFLKGYQWPFHAERLQNMGSSIIDIAVEMERQAGRRVYMDFMANPTPIDGEPFSFEALSEEARRYLERSGALQDTPYERLSHMNQPSIDIYTEHGVDLREPLEIAVCAQHCNGGLAANTWWESVNIKHLFPIGEICGTHGVRPGGSALNSGQVGGLRAAQYIANVYNQPPVPPAEFEKAVRQQVADEIKRIEQLLNASDDAPTVEQVRRDIQQRMSTHAGFIRSLQGVTQALGEAVQLGKTLAAKGQKISDRRQLLAAIQNDHLCLTHQVFLEAIKAYIERGGGSRGACVILDEDGDRVMETKKGRQLRHRSENLQMRDEILEVQWTPQGVRITPVAVRPVPQDDSWYETTWAAWRKGEIFR